MLLGIFGDIHGNLAALSAVIDDGRKNGVERWICLGDICFRGPQPVECLELLAGMDTLTCIAGNTDQWLFRGFPAMAHFPPERRRQLEAFRKWALSRMSKDHLKWLEAAPFCHSLAHGEENLLFVHASPYSTEDWLPPSAADESFRPMITGHNATIVVSGHVHVPYLRRISGRYVLNAGSTGHPTDNNNRASYLLLELADYQTDGGSCLGITFRRVPYNLELTAEATRLTGMPMAEEYISALRTGVPL